jgi:hypothetical protein
MTPMNIEMIDEHLGCKKAGNFLISLVTTNCSIRNLPTGEFSWHLKNIMQTGSNW